MNLLSHGSTNAKTQRSIKLVSKYVPFILYMAPASLSGRNLCPYSSAGCRAACLYTAGRGVFSNVQRARMRKARLFTQDRENFLRQLFQDLDKVTTIAWRQRKTALVRLNGTTDIDWDLIKFATGQTVFEAFPRVQFYDYTKSIKRVERLAKQPISNYHLTFSASESNDDDQMRALEFGVSVAVVFDSIPARFLGRDVISGDTHDVRVIDPLSIIVGLTAKGRAKMDETGFVKKMGVYNAY